MTPDPSQARGPSQPALLEETIGDCLRRIAAEHADREALVSCHQGLRLTYAQLDREVDRLALALLAAGLRPGDRVGIWSPELRRVDAGAAGHRARRRRSSSTSTPPTAPASWSTRSTSPGCRLLLAARAFKTSDYAAMIDEVRRELRTVERVVFLGEASWEELLAGARRCRRCCRRWRSARPTRSTSSTPAARPARRRARRSATATSSTTATSSARRCRYTPGGPGLHPGALLPLLRHGDGQPRLR